jgi:hypothetical protein
MTKHEQEARLKELSKFTTPNMRGFFPDYSSGQHSAPFTFFDTETDDRGRILTIAAHKVQYNFTKGRFENVEDKNDVGFFRAYNPPNVDNNIIRTEGKHNLFSKALNLIRGRIGATYSASWNESELEAFKQYVGNSALAGHNIAAADIPWILKPTGHDFNLNTTKQSFFDTLHFAKAVVGRNTEASLTNLRSIYAPNLNLTAHEASGDVVANIKVLEAMLQKEARGKNASFVAEALYALQHGWGVQTHWKENLNLEEGIGKIIQGVKGKPLGNLPYKGAPKSFGKFVGFQPLDKITEQVLDVSEVFGIPVEDIVEKRSNNDTIYNQFGEGVGKMADGDEPLTVNDWEAIMKELSAHRTNVGTGLDGVSFNNDSIKRLIKAMQLKAPHSGEGWDRAPPSGEDFRLLNINGDLTQLTRDFGFSGNNEDFTARMYQQALIANRTAYMKEQRAIYNQLQRKLAKYYRQYKDRPFYKAYAERSVMDVSSTDVDNFVASIHAYDERQQKEQDTFDSWIGESEASGRAKFDEALKYRQWQGRQRDAEIEAERKSAEAAAIQEAAARDTSISQAAQDISGWKPIYSGNYIVGGVVPENGYNVFSPTNKYAQLKADVAVADAMRAKARDAADRAGWGFQLSQAKEAVNTRLGKRDALEKASASGYLTAIDRAGFSPYRTAEMSLQDYNKALEKTIQTNKVATISLQNMYKAGKPFFNFAQVTQAHIQGIGEVGGAINGLLPHWAREPGNRFITAMQESVAQRMIEQNKNYSIWSNVGNIAMGAGAGAMMLPIPGARIVGGAIAGIGAGINLASNILGESEKAQVETAYKHTAMQINLFSAGLNALLLPLRLLRNGLGGFLNIFSRLGKIWGTQYGMPFSNLTGISSNHYAAMLQSDSFFGMQAGTINNMHNNFALGQAGLYTSGQYDTNRLVAAARLGVFDTVYAPMGGDTQKQQATTINRLFNRMKGASQAEKQSMLYLANQIDPNYVNILERMDKFSTYLGKSHSFEDYQSGRAFSSVWQKNMSNYENAKWEWTAGEYRSSMTQMDFGLKRLATPLWSKFGLPLMNLVNETLNALPAAIDSDRGTLWERLKPIAKNFWTDLTSIFGFHSSGDLGADIDSLWAKASKHLSDFIGSEDGLAGTIWNGLLKALDWIAGKESQLIDAFAPFLQGLKDYISSIKFNIKPKITSDGIGFDIDFATPNEVYQEQKTKANNAYESQLAQYKSFAPGSHDKAIWDAFVDSDWYTNIRPDWAGAYASNDRWTLHPENLTRLKRWQLEAMSAAIKEYTSPHSLVEAYENDPRLNALKQYKIITDNIVGESTGMVTDTAKKVIQNSAGGMRAAGENLRRANAVDVNTTITVVDGTVTNVKSTAPDASTKIITEPIQRRR